MKTLVFIDNDTLEVYGEIKVDIFATEEEMKKPGFDTRLTNMDMSLVTKRGIEKGINVKQVTYSFLSLVDLAIANNMKLSVVCDDFVEPIVFKPINEELEEEK